MNNAYNNKVNATSSIPKVLNWSKVDPNGNEYNMIQYENICCYPTNSLYRCLGSKSDKGSVLDVNDNEDIPPHSSPTRESPSLKGPNPQWRKMICRWQRSLFLIVGFCFVLLCFVFRWILTTE